MTKMSTNGAEGFTGTIIPDATGAPAPSHWPAETVMPTPSNIRLKGKRTSLAELARALKTPEASLTHAMALGLIDYGGCKLMPTAKAQRVLDEWPLMAAVIEADDERRDAADGLDPLTAEQASAAFGVTLDAVRQLFAAGRIRGLPRPHANGGARPPRAFRRRDLAEGAEALRAFDAEQSSLREAKAAAFAKASARWAEQMRVEAARKEVEDIAAASRLVAREEERRAREAAFAQIAQKVSVALPARHSKPLILAHLGPTNSGKTYAAIERLVAAGSGVYAAPLRMMAQEVHARLSARLGSENVGLVTGEERINEDARIIACTTELVPAHTRCLVLDEVHWLADSDRGAAWTAALLGAECDELHLVGSEDALPLLRAMSPQIDIVHYERFCPLEYTGKTSVGAVRPGTIAIVFGKKAVYSLARTLSARFKGRVGVLYGAMPLVDRRDQIDAFLSGKTEVLVATDVLGHGVNLPAETVLFAETSKFDGRERRDLVPWEVAQIAGRAGRYGFHESGAVGVLTGVAWAKPSERVVRAGMTPTIPVGDGRTGFRALSEAVLGPTRRDLEPIDTWHWGDALQAWEDLARDFAATRSWLTVPEFEGVRTSLAMVGPDLVARIEPADLWSLVHAPVDALKYPTQIVTRMAAILAGEDRSLDGFLVMPGRKSSLESLESYNEVLTVLRWFVTRWPGRGGIDAAGVSRVEAACHSLFAKASAAEIAHNAYGLCEDCGQACMPWFYKCESCFAASRAYRRDRWDSGGYGGYDYDEDFG